MASDLLDRIKASPWSVVLLRLSSLVVGCLATGMSYILNAFNVFALALKAQYELNQAELGVLLSLLFLGLIASLPGGLIMDRFGARTTALLALIISACGYFLIWSTTLNQLYYNAHFPLLALFFLIAGIGGGLTYMAGTASNVRNYGSERRGTVVGILHAFLSTGPAFIMLVYNYFFLNGHLTDEENQDLNGFFVFLIIAFTVVNALGVLAYGFYPPDEKSKEQLLNSTRESFLDSYHCSPRITRFYSPSIICEDPNSEQAYLIKKRRQNYLRLASAPNLSTDDEGEEKPQETVFSKSCDIESAKTSFNNNEEGSDNLQNKSLYGTTLLSPKPNLQRSVSFKKSVEITETTETTETAESSTGSLSELFSKEFQLMFWPFIILTAQQMMFVQNLTTILKSIGQEELNAYFPYITPILGTIAKPILGFSSDLLINWLPRSTFVLVGCAANLITWFFCIFYIDSVAMILIATTVCDLAAYTAYAVGPAMMIEYYGIQSFSRNWGLVMGGFAILTGVMVLLFGVFYDAAGSPDMTECYGTQCFVTTFALSTVVSFISLVCISLHLYYELKSKNNISNTST